jgi:alginate O-acetyltransferase complex protein AlgI
VVFSSSLFIYAFIPLFFVFYYCAPQYGRNNVILLASLLFYYSGAGGMIVLLLLSVVVNQYFANLICDVKRTDRRLLLAVGVTLNLATLIYFKYVDFLWQLADKLLGGLAGLSIAPAPGIILPIGISFFTFQAISYLIDVYRQDTAPAPSYKEFAVYHTLFPQLIAGPIVRYREIREQLECRQVNLLSASEGAYRFCSGFGKKVILADNLGAVADHIIKLPLAELGCAHAWLGMICYTLQIYYDFSGYSDMAIGLGKLMGLPFPENFDQPYRSASITEFWRRWHMTLTRWFRDYLYIPLGGNRRGSIRTYVNLMMVFCLCGLWHGAGLNFLVWGVYHGMLLVIERIADRGFAFRPSGPLGVAVTLLLVIVGWVFFRIDDFGTAMIYLRAMFLGASAQVVYFPVQHFLTGDVVFYLIAGIFLALVPTVRIRSLRVDCTPLLIVQLASASLVFAYASLQLAANSFHPFIYFRF